MIYHIAGERSWFGTWVEVTLRSGRQFDGIVVNIDEHLEKVHLRKARYEGLGDPVIHRINRQEIVAVTYAGE